ncbi:MAG: SRPBCC family protein [Steroidobacteraceae bacterium]
MSFKRQLSHTETFAAPAARVYELLIDWGGIVSWMPNNLIRELRLEGKGVGAIRYLTTGKGVELAERLDSTDAASTSLTLSMLPPLPWHLLSYSATGVIEPLATDTCRLTWMGNAEMPGNSQQADRTAYLLQRSYEAMFQGIRRELDRCGSRGSC